MRLRDREDRGFPSPLFLSYTSSSSSSFLPPPPCRSRCRWQGDADTSQSLPLSDEHLLPPSHLTLHFHVCRTSLPVLPLAYFFCLSWFQLMDHGNSFLFWAVFYLIWLSSPSSLHSSDRHLLSWCGTVNDRSPYGSYCTDAVSTDRGRPSFRPRCTRSTFGVTSITRGWWGLCLKRCSEMAEL